MRVAGHGRSIRVPAGWHARIFAHQGAQPIVHVATIPLRGSDGDYGAAATGRMRPGDCFAALLEFAEGGELFAGHEGLPALAEHDFGARTLQVTRAGHRGAQRFFRLGGRPLCLYAVLFPRGRSHGHELATLRGVVESFRLDPS